MPTPTPSFVAELTASAHSEGVSSFVVGIAVLHQGRILIVKRSQTDDFLASFWEIPGGEVDDGESLLQSVRRELREETHLEVQSIDQHSGHFDYQGSSGQPKRQFNFLISVKDPETLRLNPAEHSEYSWEDVQDVHSWKDTYRFTPEMKYCIQQACSLVSTTP